MADREKLVTHEERAQERQREAAREAAEREDAPPLTETERGGRYLLDDGETLVNADGKPIDKSGRVKE